jgi:hypothetical protein
MEIKNMVAIETAGTSSEGKINKRAIRKNGRFEGIGDDVE